MVSSYGGKIQTHKLRKEGVKGGHPVSLEDWGDTDTSQGTPGAPGSWSEVRNNPSPEPSEGSWPC